MADGKQRCSPPKTRASPTACSCSYPLHPPRKPKELRTSHFPKLATPAFFVHGTRDAFATPAEMQAALALIPGPEAIMEVDGAGHDLLSKKATGELPAQIALKFKLFLKLPELQS